MAAFGERSVASNLVRRIRRPTWHAAAFVLVPALLIVLQIVPVVGSSQQIRGEELSQSVRNVYWLEHRQVFSGINSHLGWYTPLRISYDLIGFRLEDPKYFRLLLHVLSFTCLTLLLRRIFKSPWALVPLVTIGLSPSLLFFNTLRTHYGIDLQYLPIVLYFLSRLRFAGGRVSFIPHVIAWAVAMVAWSAYPTFVYYLPALFLFYLYRWAGSEADSTLKRRYLLVGLVSFLLPIVLMSLQVDNKETLAAGLFRGGPTWFEPDAARASTRVGQTLLGLAGAVQSYYYELPEPDFSRWWPLLSLAAVIPLLAWYWRAARGWRRLVVSLIALTVAINVLGIALYVDVSGDSSVRRATGLIAGVYAAFCVAWYVAGRMASGLGKLLTVGLLLLLPLHHLIVLPINFAHAGDESPWREIIWLKSEGKSASESLSQYVAVARSEDLKLRSDYTVEPYSFGFLYDGIYGAVAGSCRWNRHSCRDIYGWDEPTGQFRQLRVRPPDYCC